MLSFWSNFDIDIILSDVRPHNGKSVLNALLTHFNVFYNILFCAVLDRKRLLKTSKDRDVNFVDIYIKSGVIWNTFYGRVKHAYVI